jgi:hypothetical protein
LNTSAFVLGLWIEAAEDPRFSLRIGATYDDRKPSPARYLTTSLLQPSFSLGLIVEISNKYDGIDCLSASDQRTHDRESIARHVRVGCAWSTIEVPVRHADREVIDVRCQFVELEERFAATIVFPGAYGLRLRC